MQLSTNDYDCVRFGCRHKDSLFNNFSNSSDEFRKETFLKAKCVQRKITTDFVK